MSQNTNAILVYGFDLGVEDENPLPDVLSDDDEGEGFIYMFETYIAKCSGVECQTEEYSFATKNDYNLYWDKKQQAVKACPVEMIQHCSGDYPMFILAVRGTKVIATRGNPTIIDVTKLYPTEQTVNEAREWCEKNGIQWEEPKWILCSDWN